MYPDLHRHLDGSLRPGTVADLAARRGLAVPPDLPFHAGMGLDAALARFAFTVSLLRDVDAVCRVASEIADDAAREGVSTLEVRFAPQIHGPPVPEVVDAALEGLAGRAGLVLCGLYGEDPAVLSSLVAVARSRPGVVGIDVAGGPAPSHRFGLDDYAGACRDARDAGLGVTIHAGEGRPAAEIGLAIERLGAKRVGHATTLLDDERVVALVLEREVTLEACPTSNVHTGVVPSVAAHPLKRWIARGLRCCVNTDNTLLSGVTAPQEHDRCALSPGELAWVLRCGHEAAFGR